MYLLYCDETNLRPSEADFFVYGGIAIPYQNAKLLHDEITVIRKKKSITGNFVLKFNPKPDNLSHQEYIEVKRAIIDAAIRADCKLLVSIILHKISKDENKARRLAINTVAYHFDCMLKRQRKCGFLLIDRFDDPEIDNLLRNRLSFGLEGMKNSVPLSQILGYHYSAIGQSHFCSVVDIVIGSLRYAINIVSKNKVEFYPRAKNLLRILHPLFIENGNNSIDKISLFFSPKKIKVPIYREKYQELHDFFANTGIRPMQEIYDVA